MEEQQDKEDKINNAPKKSWWKRGLRILGIITFGLLILLISVVFFVRSRWGQSIIVGQLTDYISGKTHTKVSIRKLFITFAGDIDLQGLYLEDTSGDTLLYSEKLQFDIPLWPIIKGNPISIDDLKWTGLRANIARKDSINGFNYQFLIDAFTSDSKSTITDTTSNEPPKISIGSIDISDFRVNFKDAVSGVIANVNLGIFHFEGKDFDLKKMKFRVKELALENTKVSYVITKPTPPSESTETTLPYLSLDHLKIKNVIVHYSSLPDSIVADFNLGDLQLKVSKADLSSQDIQINQFSLNNTNIQVDLNKQRVPKTKTENNLVSPESVASFIWPNWNVNVESISMANNNLHFQLGERSKTFKGFNPDYIVLTNFNFYANDIALSSNKSAKLNITDFSFNESSGLALNQLAFLATLDSTEFSVNDLVFKAGNSSMNADLKTQFSSLQQFINNPEEAALILDLKQFAIDLNDAFEIKPELRNNEYLKKLAIYKFDGKLKAKGTLSDINLSDFLVNWGQNTAIKTNGNLKNLTNFDQFIAEIENFTFNSIRFNKFRF